MMMRVGLALVAVGVGAGACLAGGEVDAESGVSSLLNGGLRLLGPEDPPADAKNLPVSSGTEYYFRVSGWYTGLDASVTYGERINNIDPDFELGGTLNYEKNLWVPRGEFGMRFDGGFHLDFALSGPFRYDGEASREFTYGDYTFDAGAETELDFFTFAADFGYEVVQTERFTLSLDAGIRGLGFHFLAKGNATDAEGNPRPDREEEVYAGAAVPVIGMDLRWYMTRRLYFSAKAMAFFAGRFSNAHDTSLELGWDFTRNFGLFVGYRHVHFALDNISIDGSSLAADTDLYGPYAGVELRF